MKWQTEKLGKIAKFTNGRAYKAADWREAGTPIIRIQNLNDKGKSFNYWAGSLDGQVLVKQGDVLLAWSGTPGTSFGAHIWNGENGVLNQHIFLVHLDSKKIEKRWAVRAMNDKLNHLIDQAHGGVGLKHVNKSQVEDLDILLPPIEEQRRLISILDKADALHSKRAETIKMLDQFLRSVFLEMFGDPVRNEKGWEVVPLKAISTFMSGGTPSKSKPEYWAGTFPWVSPKDMKTDYIVDSIDHISEKVFNETSLKRIPPFTILIVIRGMILIHTLPIALNTVPVAINQDMKAITPNDNILPEYLYWALRTQDQSLLSQVGIAAHGTGRLEMRVLENTPIILPKKSQQQLFVNLVRKFKSSYVRIASQETIFEELFQSLTQRAFRGEL